MRIYVEMLFEDAPRTYRAWELKEELIANIQERFQDMLDGGMNPEQAYQNAIASIGNKDELFEGLEEYEEEDAAGQEVLRKKKAVLNAVSGCLFLFGVAVFLMMTSFDGVKMFQLGFDWSTFGLVMMLLIFMIPVSIQIYVNSAYPDKNKKYEKEYVKKPSGRTFNRKMRSSITQIVWLTCLIFYFLLSFTTHRWEITWVLFLIAACFSAVVKLVFSFKEG